MKVAKLHCVLQVRTRVDLVVMDWLLCAVGVAEMGHSVRWRLQELPAEGDKWRAAKADVSDTAVVPALGWFESAPSDDIDSNSKESDSLWVVLKFEGLQPAQGFAKPMPLQEQAHAQRGFGLFSMPEDALLRRRKAYLRALFSGACAL
jgi:hypothetical protein